MKKPQRKWTEKEIEILKENYPKGGSPMVRNILIEDGFPLRSKSAICSRAYQLGLKSPLRGQPNSGCFKKGAIPANKGKKMSKEVRKRVQHTWFKKGHVPANSYGYDYAVSFRPACKKKGECGWWVKLEKGRYLPLNQFAWQEVNGPQPKNHLVMVTDVEEFYRICNRHFPLKAPKEEPEGHWPNLVAFVRKVQPLLKLMTRKENLARNYDKEKATLSVRTLGYNYVAGIMTHNDPELRQKIKEEHPGLIAVKRQQLLNKRLIKNLKP